ncbi:aromatic motif membrane protein [Ureaplasma diversum]|uniref:aromatic motif membrane protein n=1 Tax=Ureaplasma diversum TaxID=42094 RepID=UPI00056FD8BA|nr:aromatic motif membrane protein [Ureaplasma diversum]
MKKFNKKWLFVAGGIVGASIITSAVLATTLSANKQTANETVEQSSEESELDKSLHFNKQIKVKELLSSFFDQDEDEVDQFVFGQNQIQEQQLSELKSALTYYHPHRTKGLTDYVEGQLKLNVRYKRTRLRSRDFLFRNITSNWYWMLKNANNLEFMLWPYEHDKFRKNDLEQSSFINSKYKFKAKINEKNEIEFDTSLLPKGYAYEYVGYNPLTDRGIIESVYSKTLDNRAFNKVTELVNKELVMHVQMGANHANKSVDLVLKDQQNNYVEVNTTTDSFGLASFNLESISPWANYTVAHIKLSDGSTTDAGLSNYHKLTLNLNNEKMRLEQAKKDSKVLFKIHKFVDTNEQIAGIKGREAEIHFIIRNEDDHITKIKNPVIEDFYLYKYPASTRTIFSSKEVYYIKYDGNKLIRLIKLKRGQQKLARLDYDLLVFKEPIQDIKAVADVFEKSIIDQDEKEYQAERDKEIKKLEAKWDKNKLQDFINKQTLEFNYKFEQSNFNVAIFPRILKYNYHAWRELEKKFSGVKIYTLKSLDGQAFLRSIKSKKSIQNNDNKPIKYPEFVRPFVDEKINIKDNSETVQERRSKEILKILLNQVFKSDLEIKDYVDSQTLPENKAKIEAELRRFAARYRDLKGRFGADAKINELDDHNNEYNRFLSKNWYFLLTNLHNFDFNFIDWFRLPEFHEGNKHAKHTQKYLEKLQRVKQYEDFRFNDSLLDDIRESDVSKVHKTTNDNVEYFIVKNNVMFWVRVYAEAISGHDVGIEILPYVIQFKPKDVRAKISVPIITNVFHLSFIHGDQQYYEVFEDKITAQYGYPAKMLMIYRSAKK